MLIHIIQNTEQVARVENVIKWCDYSVLWLFCYEITIILKAVELIFSFSFFAIYWLRFAEILTE